MPGPETPEVERGPEEELSEADKTYRETYEYALKELEIWGKGLAERNVASSGRAPEEFANEWAKEGAISWTIDYLELSKLSPAEKRKILGLAYENRAKKEERNAEILAKRLESGEESYMADMFRDFRKSHLDAAQAFYEKARILRGETEGIK